MRWARAAGSSRRRRSSSLIWKPRRGSPVAPMSGPIFPQRLMRLRKCSRRSRASLAASASHPPSCGKSFSSASRSSACRASCAWRWRGFDVAAWDALAIAAGWPLATLLGSTPKRIPAYNSCGLGLMAPQRVADEAEKLLAGGFRAVKLRLGYPTLADDLAALRAVRKRLGGEIAVMVDYNQALSLAQALERGRALDQEDIYWLEEPIRHDDYAGNATLVRELKTPIQIGENFSESSAMAVALAAGAADYVMPDLERIGGVTGWLRAAALAATHRIEMSSHLFPEVSAHLLAATPTAHFLEYMDWADKILAQPLEIVDGFAVVPQRPGNGLTWDAKAVKKYRIA